MDFHTSTELKDKTCTMAKIWWNTLALYPLKLVENLLTSEFYVFFESFLSSPARREALSCVAIVFFFSQILLNRMMFIVLALQTSYFEQKHSNIFQWPDRKALFSTKLMATARAS